MVFEKIPMNFVIFHLTLKDQSWTCHRPLKKGLTKADVICMKYTVQNRTIFYLAAMPPPFSHSAVPYRET